MMLALEEANPIEMLRQFGVYLNADLIEDLGAATLVLDNEKGKGRISIYELIPGLSAWIYDIVLEEELEIKAHFSKEKCYYFGYNLVGSQLQKFPEEAEYKKLHQHQNFIIISKPGEVSHFVVPKEIPYQCCYIIVNPKEMLASNIHSKTKLAQQLIETFEDTANDQMYRYFGDIDMRTRTYADILVNNTRTDIVGRLVTEAAVLNTLGSQIEAHDQDTQTDNFRPELTKEELFKISEMGDYVLEHISEKLNLRELSDHLQIPAKKIQAGIRFLYGCSANDYVTRLRLEKAKELMQTTAKNISEICYSIGYQSRSYFSKKFQETYGMLPSAYKSTLTKDRLFYEISYRSLAVPSIQEGDVDEIVQRARQNNLQFNITGCLIYHRKIFFQLIEGNKHDILSLYDKLCQDHRHTDIQLMWKGHKIKRDFDNWSMATLTDEKGLNVKVQGDIQHIELGNVLGNLSQNSLASESLWRKVRNTIKTSDSSGR